jgi:regulator of protease activity HflC (stomatin/prohibitin superfamily)
MTDSDRGEQPAVVVPVPVPGLTERPARTQPGFAMVAATIVLLVVGIVLIGIGAAGKAAPEIILGILLAVAGSFLSKGLVQVAPGRPRVVQLFGHYTGTVRSDGLQWVNPFSIRMVVSTRIRSHETAVAKVNDADGNPIEIAAVVVWFVTDTARATYGVDNLTAFMATQTETAVRHIATSYPYDTNREGQMSLRENAQEITAELSEEIAARVTAAGVTIVESRLTRLSYAPEIAQAMLRRQQAGAVVAARQRIVEGAVGMVEMALNRLAEAEVVELDEERKATMVSNLLVVLCSEQATQPVVNTGSLYQ